MQIASPSLDTSFTSDILTDNASEVSSKKALFTYSMSEAAAKQDSFNVYSKLKVLNNLHRNQLKEIACLQGPSHQI